MLFTHMKVIFGLYDMLLSSVNFIIFDALRMSLTYLINRRESSISPCGTPQFIRFLSDLMKYIGIELATKPIRLDPKYAKVVEFPK